MLGAALEAEWRFHRAGGQDHRTDINEFIGQGAVQDRVLSNRRRALFATGSASACSLLGLARPAAAEPRKVLVVQSHPAGPYAECVEAIRATLKQLGHGDVQLVAAGLPQLRDAELDRHMAIVALGREAAQRTIPVQGRTPVVAALLTRFSFDRIAGEVPAGLGTRPAQAVYLDQPQGRVLNLVRAALPGMRNVLVLASEREKSRLANLAALADERKLKLTLKLLPSERDVYPALQRYLSDNDVLLMLPDAKLFNARTSYGVLHTAYRLKVPVVAYSSAYVRNGALLSLSCTPAQVGAQVARTVLKILAGQRGGADEYPHEFTVDINPSVARALNLPAIEFAEIKRALIDWERKE